MAEQIVELQPAESQLVSFEAIPHEAKTCQVVVNGLEGSFKAVAAPAAKFYMPSKISGRAKYAPLLQWQYHYVDFWNSITNKGNAAGAVRLTYYDTIGFIQGTITMALEPGETKVWRVGAGMRIDFTRASPYTLTLIGDWAGDNIAKITVRSSQLSYVRGSDWVDL